MHIQRLLVVTAIFTALAPFTSFAQSTSNPNDPQRQQAMQLYEQHKLPEGGGAAGEGCRQVSGRRGGARSPGLISAEPGSDLERS